MLGKIPQVLSWAGPGSPASHASSVTGSMLGTEPVPGGGADALTEVPGWNLHGRWTEPRVKPALGFQKQETKLLAGPCDGPSRWSTTSVWQGMR